MDDIDPRFIVGLLAVALLVLVWGNRNGGPFSGTPGVPEVMPFEDDDAEMAEATRKARETVGVFVDALAENAPGCSRFSVKVGIEDGEDAEHFWLNDVRYAEGTFKGTIANDPVHVQSVQFGQAIEVSRDEISDWMYIEDGKLVGGYSIRVMLATLSPEQRSEFDATAGFQVD